MILSRFLLVSFIFINEIVLFTSVNVFVLELVLQLILIEDLLLIEISRFIASGKTFNLSEHMRERYEVCTHGAKPITMLNPANPWSFGINTSLDACYIDFFNSSAYCERRKYSTARKPVFDASKAEISEGGDSSSGGEILLSNVDRLVRSINKHVEDYSGLIEIFNRMVEVIDQCSLMYVEREANKTRAVLERALVCIHGVSSDFKALSLEIPKLLRNRLTVTEIFPDYGEYMDDSWGRRVPGVLANRRSESLYSCLERNVICYKTGLPSIYPKYHYEQLAVSVVHFTDLADALGVKYESGEIVAGCISAEYFMPGGRDNRPRTAKDMVVACVEGLRGSCMGLFRAIGFRLARICQGATEALAELRLVRRATQRVAVMEMYPEELVDVFKLRVKKEWPMGNEASYLDSLGFEEILSRVQLLIKSAEVAVEKARSITLEANSRFMVAALAIVRETGSDSWERQVALEHLSLLYEKNFINELLKDFSNNMQGARGMVYGLFSKCLPNIIESVKAIVDKAESDLLADLTKLRKAKMLMAIYILGPETVASVAFSNLVRLSGSSGGVEEMDVINHISESIFIHVKHKRKIEGRLPRAVKNMWERRDEVVQLSAVDKVEVGQTLLDICLQCCPQLFERVSTMVSRDERVNWIVIKKEFTTYMTNFAFNPVRLPMLHRPRDWCLDEGGPSGGYLFNLYNELVNSKGLVHQELGSRYRSQIGEDQINAVNFLNAQKFEINEDMLEHLLEEWQKEDSYIFGKYNKACEDEGFNAEVQEHNSLYWMYRNILNLALLFRGEVFYLPVFMDFRGRIYPTVNYLTYQGGDVARSLICFHRSAYRSSDNEHILIYLSNVFGLKNKNMKFRIEWAKANIPKMLRAYLNDRPLFAEQYLNNAKEKAQFMSCVLAILRSHLMAGGDYGQCKLPVLFDATCSGMQHLSALTTDLDLAALVNLTSGGLKDFYAHCAETVRLVISELPDPQMRKKLGEIKVDRKLVKLPVMTIPYNIGLKSLTGKITDNFIKSLEGEGGNKKLKFVVPGEFTVNGKDVVLNGQEAGKLGSLVFHTVKRLMPPIQPLKDYFTGILKVLAKVNKPIFWVTPVGMTIWGSATATTSKRVKTSFLKDSKPVTIRIPSDNYDYPGINRSLMANFIHSMDAANIHYLIKLILENPELRSQNINLYTIHDCFASVNDQMDVMEKLVRKAFSLLYFEQNYLASLDTCLLAQIQSYGVEIRVSDEGERTAFFARTNSSTKVDTLAIPKLPDFNWVVNKDYLKEQIMLSEYFIS